MSKKDAILQLPKRTVTTAYGRCEVAVKEPMRLIKLTLSGYRRFEKADLSLDGRILAFIGPNEAGKSSIFAALQEIDRGEPVPPQDTTRGLVPQPVPEQICLVARYLLNDDERAIATELGSPVIPRWYVYEKKHNGGVVLDLQPAPERDRTKRTLLSDSIGMLIASPHFIDQFDVEGATSDDPGITLRSQLTTLRGHLLQAGENLDEAATSLLDISRTRIASELEEAEDGAHDELMALLLQLAEVQELESKVHPRIAMLERVSNLRPKCLLFTQADRQLRPEYPLSDLNDPPPALRNLLTLAEFSPTELLRVVETGNHAHRAGMQNQINKKLKEKFQAAWQQSAVHPYFHFEADVLRVHVSTMDTYTTITERSDGLRTFVALWTFIAIQNAGPKPILLVDEAESHLHYDAQGDLVRIFYEQKEAEQLFYSTHSAGCLPHDLGTAIRVVRPLYDEVGDDTGRSEIHRSFWTDAKPGFSPLMFAIGASAFSMVPTRRVVLAEGAVDCILLPTLMREATGLSDLDFQIAPGLASVAPGEVPDLDMEAPRVAFIVDGDSGGVAIASKLKSGGYSPEQIVSLESGFVLEDYVAPDVYLSAVNEELRRSHGSRYVLTSVDVPSQNRPGLLVDWCAAQSINIPNKVAVAERILEQRFTSQLLDPTRQADLLRCHRQLEEQLTSRRGGRA